MIKRFDLGVATRFYYTKQNQEQHGKDTKAWKHYESNEIFTFDGSLRLADRGFCLFCPEFQTL
jgi:hypothetical protein